MTRDAIGAVAGLCLLVAGCSAPGSAPPSDAAIPARDLTLAELARAQDPPTTSVVHVRPRPSATAAIRADVAAGGIEPWEADAMLLRLMLGRVEEVPDRYRPEGAILTVPDFLPFEVRSRLWEYPEAEAGALRGLLAEVTGQVIGDDAGVSRVFGVPGLAALGGARPGLAPPPVFTVQEGIVEIRAHGAEAVHGDLALTVAGEAWPRIADYMQVTIGEITRGARVRFRQPLTTEAQEFLADNGLPPDAVGEAILQGSANPVWWIEFGQGQQIATFPVDIELVQPVDAPIVVHLVEGPDDIPYSNGDSVRGRFLGCSAIYVVTGDAVGECSISGRLTHELFHCAQALRVGATNSAGLAGERAMWAIEGSAMWAMDYFRPGDNHEWSHAREYAEGLTATSLDELYHYSGTFFTFLAEHGGGATAVRDLYDAVPRDYAREDLGNILGFPQDWHRYAASTTGYEALFAQGTPRLADAGGEFPYKPMQGCDEVSPIALGQEYAGDPVTLSPREAPVFDLAVEPLSVWHQRVEVVDADKLQFIDVALAGGLDGEASAASPELEVKAVLIGMDGSETVQDWTERWRSADGPSLKLEDDAAEPPFGVSTDASFRICLTDDAPCEDAGETFPTLSEVRVYVSWASVQSFGELAGQVVMMPGGIRGWTAKAYRDGSPEPEEQQQ